MTPARIASVNPDRGADLGDDTRPLVPLPSAGPPLIFSVLAFAVLAIVLFFVLEGRRRDAGRPLMSANPSLDSEVLAEPPALQIPRGPTASPRPRSPPPSPPEVRYIDRPGPPPPPVIRYLDRPSVGPSMPSVALGKLNEPALVVDLGDGGASAAPTGDEVAARATVLRNKSALVQQGTLIPAVLESPIDSTRPGPVRAMTTAETRGFDGSKVLIPRGSRLVGEFKADVQQGQRRVLVTWNRLVRPDGVAIRLTSPATDTLGGVGIAGQVNTHALARVGSVVLQTALTVGVNLASRPGNGSVVVGLPSQVASGTGQTLLPSSDFKPTITVQEGAAITVFVVRDLDFGRAVPRQ